MIKEDQEVFEKSWDVMWRCSQQSGEAISNLFTHFKPEMLLLWQAADEHYQKHITVLEAEKDGQENAAIYWHGNYNNLEEAKDKRIAELKEKLEIKNAVIERWEEEFDHMASQEFCEEIEVISEGDADE